MAFNLEWTIILNVELFLNLYE